MKKVGGHVRRPMGGVRTQDWAVKTSIHDMTCDLCSVCLSDTAMIEDRGSLVYVVVGVTARGRR